MREKIEEYIVKLDKEIKGLETWIDEHSEYNSSVVSSNRIGRLSTLLNVKNALQGILNEFNWIVKRRI